MSRNLMPKSGAMAPYIVVNRDAAVAGVFSIDGQVGIVDLTTKYVQISSYTIDKTAVDLSIESLNTAVAAHSTAIADNSSAIAANTTAIGNNTTAIDSKADKGANSDITELNALTKAITIAQGGTGVATQAAIWPTIRPEGSTPLSSDPVNAYDATTKRWVENLIGAGATGPTMNGVMNYGVGSRELWQSRSYIPPYALPLDGQIVNRADWPELWAHAQMHGAIPDADWQADTSKRSFYSTGNGTTTFRLPDLNGIQVTGQNGITGPSSIKGLFGRGDAGIDSGVAESGAPEIAGEFIAGRAGGNVGSFVGGPSETSSVGVGAPVGNEFRRLFKASLSSPVYGRSPSEIRPNSFYSTWIVRASGGFTAANTSWSVINGDAVLPGTGTSVYGGSVNSEYKVNGITRNKMELKVREVVGGDVAPIIVLTSKGGTPITKTLATVEDTQVKYVSWNDPSVSSLLTFAITSGADELLVSITPTYIHLYGIARKAFDSGNTGIVTISALPEGKTVAKTGHGICHITGGATTGAVPAIIPSTSGGAGTVIRISAPATAATAAIIDITIALQ